VLEITEVHVKLVS